jgi:hypothetical protein
MEICIFSHHFDRRIEPAKTISISPYGNNQVFKVYQPAKTISISPHGNNQIFKVLRNPHLKCRRNCVYKLLAYH